MSKENNLINNITLQEVVPVMVTIQSIPREADIYINNVNEGKTNKQLFKFPGEYSLRLSKDNYGTVEQTITVTESGRNTWSFTLQKTTAILSLSVTPPDADVYINGTLERERSIELAPGRYRIEVKKDGWYDESRTITIQKGTDQRQSFTLKQMTGTLQFVVEPMETQVTLKSGETTVESWTGSKYLRDIPVGNYTLNCDINGYENQSIRVLIEENITTSLNVKMEKTTSFIEESIDKTKLDVNLIKYKITQKRSNGKLINNLKRVAIGVNTGPWIPVGQNISDSFNIGVSISILAEIPVSQNLSFGMNMGYSNSSADFGDDISCLSTSIYVDRNIISLMQNQFNFGTAWGFGTYFLSRTESYMGFGLNGDLYIKYHFNNKLQLYVKLGMIEYLVGFDKDVNGTMEWLDFRLGLNYHF